MLGGCLRLGGLSTDRQDGYPALSPHTEFPQPPQGDPTQHPVSVILNSEEPESTWPVQAAAKPLPQQCTRPFYMVLDSLPTNQVETPVPGKRDCKSTQFC